MPNENKLDRIDKALAVLNSDISGYKINKTVGMSESAVSRYRLKQLDINSLKLGHIIELADFYEKYFE